MLPVVVEASERVDRLLSQDRDLGVVAVLHRVEQRARQLGGRGGWRNILLETNCIARDRADGDTGESCVKGAIELAGRIGALDERRSQPGLH